MTDGSKGPLALPEGLVKHPEGYWVSRGQGGAVSYPDDAHDALEPVEERSFWFRHRNAVIAAIVERFPPDGALVDIGGGNGGVALYLQSGGAEVILVEPGLGGARNAARRGVAAVICSTLETAGFSPGSLPAAGLFDVLEHTEDDVAFLRSLHDRMRPGGRLYVTVPAGRALWSTQDGYAGHHRRYSEDSLRSSLEQAGFRVEFSSHFFSLLPLPILLMRALPSRLGLGRDSAPTGAGLERDHLVAGGRAARLVERGLRFERRRILGGGKVMAGSSCLAVARA